MDDILSAYAEIPSIAQKIGYEMKTTWWGDFTVAERISGIEGIKDTFRRGFNVWKDDEVYITEMYLVANWKEWQHVEMHRDWSLAYNEIQVKIDDYIEKYWSQEQKQYFYKTTD